MAFLVSFSRGGCVAGLAIVAADTAAPTSELVVSDIQIVGPQLHPLPGREAEILVNNVYHNRRKTRGFRQQARLKCKALVDRLLRQAMPKYGRPLAA